MVAIECENACLKHTYSFQRTGVAHHVTFDGSDLVIHGAHLLDANSCPEQFTVIGWSQYGNVNFAITSLTVIIVLSAGVRCAALQRVFESQKRLNNGKSFHWQTSYFLTHPDFIQSEKTDREEPKNLFLKLPSKVPLD